MNQSSLNQDLGSVPRGGGGGGGGHCQGKERGGSDEDKQGEEELSMILAVLGLLAKYSSAFAAGHYVSFVKSHDKWLFFDDEAVEATTESSLQTVFGSPYEANSNCMDHGYILMYDRTQVRA